VDAQDDGPASIRGLGLVVPGQPITAGMHTATLTFTATTPGTYHYLCPVPGHAQKGMTGTFTVSSSS
jgi:plastocyanin